MEKCGKCGETAEFVWNVKDTSYCKKCHPTTQKLIKLLNEKAVNRKRLPKDLGKYFANEYVTSATLFSEKQVCTRCKQNAFHYGWYDNNYPSRMYLYCKKCNRISYKVD